MPPSFLFSVLKCLSLCVDLFKNFLWILARRGIAQLWFLKKNFIKQAVLQKGLYLLYPHCQSLTSFNIFVNTWCCLLHFSNSNKYVGMLLISIYLMTNSVEYLFMSLLAICVSSLSRNFPSFFFFFKFGCFCYYLVVSCLLKFKLFVRTKYNRYLL